MVSGCKIDYGVEPRLEKHRETAEGRNIGRKQKIAGSCRNIGQALRVRRERSICRNSLPRRHPELAEGIG